MFEEAAEEQGLEPGQSEAVAKALDASGLSGLEDKGITVQDCLNGHTKTELVAKLALRAHPADDVLNAPEGGVPSSALVPMAAQLEPPPEGALLACEALSAAGAKEQLKPVDLGKASQPRGRPPKGKLWSAELGCWQQDPACSPSNHEDPLSETRPPKPAPSGDYTGEETEEDASPDQQQQPEVDETGAKKAAASAKVRASVPGQTPQPRGRPPKGKVWDASAGTWFDDPGFVSAPPKFKKPKAAHTAEADGLALASAELEAEVGGSGAEWPAAVSQGVLASNLALSKAAAPKGKLEPGQLSQPRGRPPAGKRWDRESGEWAQDPDFVPKPKPKKPKHTAGAEHTSPSDEGAEAEASDFASAADGLGMAGALVIANAPSVLVLPALQAKQTRKTLLASGKHLQPRGRPPKGKVWDADTGEWLLLEG